jgi:hypothetical protein
MSILDDFADNVVRTAAGISLTHQNNTNQQELEYDITAEDIVRAIKQLGLEELLDWNLIQFVILKHSTYLPTHL